jgi:hypothetical protein
MRLTLRSATGTAQRAVPTKMWPVKPNEFVRNKKLNQ